MIFYVDYLQYTVKEVEELMVINDEAHHIHDSKLDWGTYTTICC
jgi:hypothetical protein